MYVMFFFNDTKILLFLLQNSQFKIESTSISNNNNESSKTPIQIQTNHSTTNQLVIDNSIYRSSLVFLTILFFI